MKFELFKRKESPEELEKPWESMEKQLKEHIANPKEIPTAELDALPLENVDNLSIEEIDGVQEKLKNVYAPFYKPTDWGKFKRSENIPKPQNFDEALEIIRKFKPEMKKLFLCHIDDEILFEKFVVRARESDRQNPPRVFGDMDAFAKDFYRKKGINVDSPTQEDVEKYQEGRVKYSLPLVRHEMDRRKIRDFSNLSEQEQADVSRIFWDINYLFAKYDEKGLISEQLRGQKWVDKLEEIKSSL